MTQPCLTVIIPTQGRKTLNRALSSIRHISQPADVEIMVIADTHTLPLVSDVRSLAESHGARYLEHDAGHHGYGHPQAEVGYRSATGRYILALGDDDEYLPGALTLVRDACDALPESAVSLWRIVMHPSPTRPIAAPWTLWADRSLQPGRISGQNACVPNDPRSMQPYPSDGVGDWAYIAETVYAWGGPDRIVWREEVIAQCH